MRVYNLDWGSPYYFHPDERNIASSISQLHYPDQLNPNFFAYGSLPIYLNYKLGILQNIFSSVFNDIDIFTVTFEQAIINGRIISAILSTGLILLTYKIGRLFLSQRWSLLPPFLTAFSTGLIQYAHFGTFETYLTFFSLLLLFLLLNYIQTKQFKYFIFSSIVVGILCSVKVSSFILIPLPILSLILIFKKSHKTNSLEKIRKIVLPLFSHSLLILLISSVIFVISNPFTFIDWGAFRNSMQYESSVALGTLPVFYTGSFTNTFPGIYQLLYIYPFILNPIITIFFIASFIYMFFYSILKKHKEFLFLILFLLFLLVPQLIFYVKWTRYIIPTLPVIYLCMVLSIHTLFSKSFRKLSKKLRYSLYFSIFSLLVSSLIWSTAFIKTVYTNSDTRVDAVQYLNNKISTETPILSEVYDLGIMPFNNYFNNITLFNFYDLEHDPNLSLNLRQKISEHDILILPSQRIIRSRLENPQTFPQGFEFYRSINTDPKFSLIYKTECSFWCKILYLGDPVFSFEDTVNVFDRPTVFIYKINHAN